MARSLDTAVGGQWQLEVSALLAWKLLSGEALPFNRYEALSSDRTQSNGRILQREHIKSEHTEPLVQLRFKNRVDSSGGLRAGKNKLLILNIGNVFY